MTGTLLDIEDMRHELAGTYLNVRVALQIKQLRLARGWSQEELARRAGIHQPQIANLESTRWKSWPQVETLEQIARAFDVSLHINFAEWSSLVTEFLNNSDIPTPADFEHDPVFQSANAENSQTVPDSPEERQNQKNETEKLP